MRELPGAYQAARREWVQLQHLPQLPGWFPLPDPDKPGASDQQRTQARAEAAMREARRGPMDGQRISVAFGESGPPLLLRVFDGGWAYRLDPADSTDEWLVYRYSPADSPQHANTMATVVEAYVEAGPAQVVAARLQQPETTSVSALDIGDDLSDPAVVDAHLAQHEIGASDGA